MPSPVKLYQYEMHNNVGFFATWLPASTIELGDLGILEAGRFRRMGSLNELGIPHLAIREGMPQKFSYTASAERKAGAFAEATGVLPVAPIANAQLSIRFTEQGGFVFEAVGIRNVEISDRIALTDRILSVHEQGRWRNEWLVVDAVYTAASATIIVSEDSSSEIVLKASGNISVEAASLADPTLGLAISSSSGKIVHVIAQSDLSPLYSCLKIRDPLFGPPSVVSVRGLKERARNSLIRLGVDDLLES